MCRNVAVALVALAAACSSEKTTPSDPPPASPATEPAPAGAPVEAPAPPPAVDAGITQIPVYDPRGGLHLDDDVAGGGRRSDRAAPRQRRILEILLRSMPGGATAAVDGVVIGQTPVLWEGDFTGREREFTFVKPGYAMARYRFIPISDGVVHGRLAKVGDGEAGGPAVLLQDSGPTPSHPAPPMPARPPGSSAPLHDAGGVVLAPDAAAVEPTAEPPPAVEIPSDVDGAP